VSQHCSVYLFPATGFARVSDIIGNRNADPPKPAFIPVSHTEWYRGIAAGRFPRGIKLSRKITVWPWEELHQLKARIEAQGRYPSAAAPAFATALGVQRSRSS
jgi:prophage regulatory protein